MFDIEEELKKLPAKPGVYLMHDKTDAIIYVGKAISLTPPLYQTYFLQPFKIINIIQKRVLYIK